MKNENKGSEDMTENNIGKGNRYEKIGDYIFWRYADDVRPYIFRFLEKEYPDAIIIHEFDKVDIFILDENLPIEIQSIYPDIRNGKGCIRIAQFEDDIRRQLETDISIYGKCILFFDESALRYIQDGVKRNSSINMDWLYQYKKEGKIRVFTITYNGIIRETADKDFSFLSNVSMTCNRGKDEDFRVITKNRANITLCVLKGRGFTNHEINNMYNLYRGNNKEYGSFNSWLSREGCTEREKEYYYMRKSINLEFVNNVLSCTIDINDGGSQHGSRSHRYMLIYLGLVDVDKYDRIYFVDKCDIAQYFPGYIRKKELWDYLRTHNVSQKTFYAIIRGETDYLWWIKNQTTIEEAWNS